MNGTVNVSIPDGWFPEFAKDNINSFLIPSCDPSLPDHAQDDNDATALYHDSNRMACEYYENLYSEVSD